MHPKNLRPAVFSIQQFWRRRGVMNFALLPFAALFGAAVFLRRRLYRWRLLKTESVAAPVIIVGNIVAGGGGKTPLVIALVHALRQRGFSPGVAARGVGGNFSGALLVGKQTTWRQCGDEPLMIYQNTGAPVCVGKKRVAAARRLIQHGCDVIVCDDGLQHYALHRDVEVCAVSADFGAGNGWLLPAGPLREGGERLRQCDWIVCGGEGRHCPPQGMRAAMQHGGFFALGDMQTKLPASFFVGKKIVLLAGIAAPQRFFTAARAAGIVPHAEYPLPDHARMADKLLADIDAEIILMTEKDAVKYAAADSRLYAMRTAVVLPPAMADAVVRTIRQRVG